MADDRHAPVLVNEVIEGLRLRSDGTYIDATTGYGGHTRAILSELGAAGRVIALDRDPAAVAAGRRRWHNERRVHVLHARFSAIGAALGPLLEGRRVAGILFDLGVSSPQLDEAERGFSFSRDGPLDMRMEQGAGESATAYLGRVREIELVEVLSRLGEERFARRIAAAVLARRATRPLRTTLELATLVAGVVPTREPAKHPATRTFQALRMRINGELEELRAALPQTPALLEDGGRLVVLSFHSLEDREVKHFMRGAARADPFPPDLAVRASELRPVLKLVGKARRPGAAEIKANPRARSAIMRVAERVCQ